MIDNLFRKKTLFYSLLGAFFVSNLVVGQSFELSFDESYYWVYAKYLDWGYFDHPPMVAVFIKLGTALFGNTELGVRLFFNVAMVASLVVVNLMLVRKYSLGLIIAASSFPLLSLSGLFALPDTPLLFFAVLYFYFLKRYYESDGLLNCMLLAIAIAGMFYSKYHGLLIVLLTVCSNLGLLKKKSFWIVVVSVCAFYFPHVYWQFQHDFISFRFHLTGRVEKHFDPGNIINYLLGQLFLQGLTLLVGMLFVLKKMKIKDSFKRALLFNSVGFLVFLLLLSFRNQIEANWTVTCSVAFLLLTFDSLKERHILYLTILPVLITLIFRFVLVSPGSLDPYLEAKSDNRLNEIMHWRDRRIPNIVKSCEGKRIVADSYQVAAKLSFYLNQEIPALHLGSRESQYSLWAFQKSLEREESFCYLTSKKKYAKIRIETNFKDPVYIIPETSLGELALKHGMTYEEVIRN